MQSESFPGQYGRLNADVFWLEGVFVWVWAYTWVFSLDPEDRTLSWVICSPDLLPALAELSQSVPGRAGPAGSSQALSWWSCSPWHCLPNSPLSRRTVESQWHPKWMNAEGNSASVFKCWFQICVSISMLIRYLQTHHLIFQLPGMVISQEF